MIAALMIGRAGSTGFPGKNVSLVLGRPLCEYPLMAASGSTNVDRIFISTDSDQIRKIGEKYNATHIERPAHLATSTALSDDVFVHAFGVIKETLAAEGHQLDFLVLLFANAATIKTEFIDQASKCCVTIRKWMVQQRLLSTTCTALCAQEKWEQMVTSSLSFHSKPSVILQHLIPVVILKAMCITRMVQPS